MALFYISLKAYLYSNKNSSIEINVYSRLLISFFTALLRFDEVSWEDLLDTTSDDRYFDSTKVFEYLTEAVRHVVYEIRADMVSACVGVLESNTVTSLWFQLSENTFYRVNLFPTIRVNYSCENFQFLTKEFPALPEILLDECGFEKGIQVVARPPNTMSKEENRFWSITFDDIEKRVVFSETFECAKDCFVRLNEISLFKGEGKHLSSYQIQAIVLREIFTRPNSKAWKRKRLNKRLLKIWKSLNICLRVGRCGHVFTGENLFAGMSQNMLDEIAKFVESQDFQDL